MIRRNFYPAPFLRVTLQNSPSGNVKFFLLEQLTFCHRFMRLVVCSWCTPHRVIRISAEGCRVHLKTVKSICSVCYGCFASDDVLRNHHNRKHAENPILFYCKYCNKPMKDPAAIKRHEKKYCHENPKHTKSVNKWAVIVEKIFFWKYSSNLSKFCQNSK